MKLLLGYDIGSSFIKVCLLDAETGRCLASASSPETEMPIESPHPGFAEQDPRRWWFEVKRASAKIFSRLRCDPKDIKGIGIAYQMHGLVLVDEQHQVLAPSIIWCDSRCTQIGDRIASEIGPQNCLRRLLNLPGTFTGSKMAWVRENQPEVFSRVHKFMLPGDYIAMKMSGQIKTTPSGLSEGVLWDFTSDSVAEDLLDCYGISPALIADTAPNLAFQGELTRTAAEELGLAPGIPIGYRAGDQPNNALALNVLEPGEVAVTAGTSGVAYGIAAGPTFDPKSRVNPFLHVNHDPSNARLGVLLCLNGTGILNSWLRQQMGDERLTYDRMNELAAQVEPGCQGLSIFPYGNGGERTLENRNIGATVQGWHFNLHQRKHFFRAAQEGIVFALNYGMKIMRGMGIDPSSARAGHANMFLSETFAKIFSTVTNTTVDLFDTDGAQGAARGAGLGLGLFKSREAAFEGLEPIKTVLPDERSRVLYQGIYEHWEQRLTSLIQKG